MSSLIDFAFDVEDFSVILTDGVPWSWLVIIE